MPGSLGKVITFYSFKGGVGRTMALANIALALNRSGERVLAVDFDLEAPGLDRYFRTLGVNRSKPGLIDMLHAAWRRESTTATSNWREYIVPLSDSSTPVPLDLLLSGRDDAEYSGKVLRFDWEDFFNNGDGGIFIESLRHIWRSEYDFILIDSRTGITDAGGVCTIQLPDVLIPMFTSNEQSLIGVRDVARRAQQRRDEMEFDRFPLVVFPVPSRFDGRVEIGESREWLDRFAKELAEFYGWLPAAGDITPRRVLERFKIPYIAFFSFGEKLPILTHGTNDPEGLGYAYDSIGTVLRSNFQALLKIGWVIGAPVDGLWKP